VTFVTPVLFGSEHFPPSLSARTFSYKRGVPLHRDQVPAICATLSPGMLIDFPEHDLEHYMDTVLSWLHLPEDHVLIKNLQQLLKRDSMRNNPIRISDIDIMTSPLFNSLD